MVYDLLMVYYLILIVVTVQCSFLMVYYLNLMIYNLNFIVTVFLKLYDGLWLDLYILTHSLYKIIML